MSYYHIQVEYDMINSSEDDLQLLSVDRIEQSSIPTAITWYPPLSKESFLLTANDQVLTYMYLYVQYVCMYLYMYAYLYLSLYLSLCLSLPPSISLSLPPSPPLSLSLPPSFSLSFSSLIVSITHSVQTQTLQLDYKNVQENSPGTNIWKSSEKVKSIYMITMLPQCIILNISSHS